MTKSLTKTIMSLVQLQQDFYSSSMSDRVGGFDMFPKQPARGSARSESDFYDSSSSSESGSNSSSSSDDDSSMR
jgi:hypothetical protein